MPSAQDCWAPEPARRPSMQEVERRLGHILEQLPAWHSSEAAGAMAMLQVRQKWRG